LRRKNNNNEKTPRHQGEDEKTPQHQGGKTTNILAKCKDYHNKADELFDDASREVNDDKT
jgi:hypothetical protein